jgi:AraC-like DNA-binding protein
MRNAGKLLAEDSGEGFLKISYPSALDAALVDYYFEIQQPNPCSDYRVNGLPSANTLIAFNLTSRPWHSANEKTGKLIILSGSQVMGQSSVLHTGVYPAAMHAFFVKLKPGIASILFHENACNMENQQIELPIFWSGSTLGEQMHECATFSERVCLVRSELLNRISRNYDYFKVQKLNEMHRTFSSLQLRGGKTIEHVCKDHWVSYSSARRYFLDYVGFAPKYCQKTTRLKNALKEYQKVGYQFYYEDFGYTDFSHFARDTKQLTGRTPSSLI